MTELQDLYKALARSEKERLELKSIANKLTKALRNIELQCWASTPPNSLPSSLAGAELTTKETNLLRRVEDGM